MTEPPPTPSVEELLAERYGTRSSARRRWALLAIVALALLFVGFVAWVAWTQSTESVQGELQGFDVTSAHEVEVVIVVQRDSGDAVECTVEARAPDHGLVASQQVVVPAGADGKVTFTTTLATERQATSVTVTDCDTAD